MEANIRRYDIDWLRVIAIGFLLIYHIGIGFQPWGVFIGFIQNDKPLEALWAPMSMLNIWRIPLLFFVSGMGVCFALKKRTFKQLIGERARRILIPFLFGIIAIVPIHLLIWLNYYNQDLSYILNKSHLWFLGNIFTYVLMLSPLFFYLRKNYRGRFHRIATSIYKSPVGILLISLIFAAEAFIINPESYETFSNTLHGYLVGLLSFFFGFTIVYSGDTFWKTAVKWRFGYLAAAVLLFIVRYFLFNLQAPGYLKAAESTMWIFSAFGFSYRYLNRPSKALTYLSRAVYPVYIIHMVFLYLGSALIMPLSIPAGLKFMLVVAITFIGCFAVYELLIRRIKYLRPLFGLKFNQ